MIGHHLNRTLEVWRTATADDGAGGQTVTLAQLDSVQAKVDQPTPDEQRVAHQWGAKHTHNIYFAPDVDVARNDELRGDGQVFHVLSVVVPSSPRYRKAQAELVQGGA